jgi:hypothetical protein
MAPRAYSTFDAGDRPCGLDSAPSGAAGWRRSTPPPFRGLGNFAAQRSRGMARRARGKFLLNEAGATRHGPRRQVARQERGCMGGFPRKGLLPKTGRPNGTTAERGRIEHPGVKRQRDRDACRKLVDIASIRQEGWASWLRRWRCVGRGRPLLAASGLSVAGRRPPASEASVPRRRFRLRLGCSGFAFRMPLPARGRVKTILLAI